jgi:hypothetical protein
MQKLIAALAFIPTMVLATDWGTVQLGGYISAPETGPYTDTAEFTTTASPGPATIVVSGGLKIYGGSGRGGGYHDEYQLAHVTSANVVDGAGNRLCTLQESLSYTGRSAPYNAFEVWSCTAQTLAAGTYTIEFSGYTVFSGNITTPTYAYATIHVVAQ